jgi:deferrochelatase/peroxidase EfeB
LNADLNTRIEKLNIASSSVEHVSICNRCKDFDIDACKNHASTILKLNDEVANLNAQHKICKKCEKIKFVRDAYTIGRHPSIKDGLGFQKGTKNLTSQKASNLILEKGKAPLASSSHSLHDKKNHAYLYAHVKNVFNVAHHDVCHDCNTLPMRHDVVFDSHDMYASSSSSYVHGRSRLRRHVHNVVSHAPRNAPNGQTMLLSYLWCFICVIL